MGEAAETYPRFKTEEGAARYQAAYAAALTEWPVPYEALEIATRLGPTHVIASGPHEASSDAAPLILLPSLAATGLVWRANIAALSRTRRCYAIDVIGQPGSSLASRRIDDPGEYAAWIVDVMDGLGVSKAAFVGCSFGGYLAARQALATPQRVERVALIGPIGVFAAMLWSLVLRMRTMPLRRRLRRLFGDERPPSAAALHARAAPQHPEDAAWRRLMGVTLAERPALTVTQAPPFSRVELGRIAAPMLLLVGEYEQAYEPHAALRRARRLKPDIEAEIVPAADHIAAMAQPDWVNARLEAFLGEAG